jgi:hypothetical protein
LWRKLISSKSTNYVCNVFGYNSQLLIKSIKAKEKSGEYERKPRETTDINRPMVEQENVNTRYYNNCNYYVQEIKQDGVFWQKTSSHKEESKRN